MSPSRDERTVSEATKGFYESRLKIEASVWEKGKIVAEYRGVNSAVTYAELMRLTSRDEKSLKAWCELYERSTTPRTTRHTQDFGASSMWT